jgi:hypothetical protein
MTIRARTPEETYGPALARARQRFTEADPAQMAICASARFLPLDSHTGRFSFPFFGSEHQILWPSGDARQAIGQGPADVTTHLLLLHYLLTADGTPMACTWIAFRNLPGGLGYDAAFQGRANLRLAQRFGADGPALEAAARTLQGERLAFGDASFSFRALPSLWLAVVLNLADDEFPAEANILFDAAASHYLPTEDLAVLGGLLASRLLKTAQTL